MIGYKNMIINLEETFGNLISKLFAEDITQYCTCAFESRRRGSEEDVVIQVSTQILNNHMTGSKYMIMKINKKIW